jgi:hypothetical protein
MPQKMPGRQAHGSAAVPRRCRILLREHWKIFCAVTA